MTERFDAYCRRKEHAALAAAIPGYATREVRLPGALVSIESGWSSALFDGPFYRSAEPAAEGVPVTSLVFVQSHDGNTVASDPSSLGGGDTDLHLIYEGLSRADADAVLAGSATARGKDVVFSVWHPELVALRRGRGRTRHPAQIVATAKGDLRFDEGLMFQEPSLRVFVITRSSMVERIRERISRQPWIDVVDAGEPVSFLRAFKYLRRRGIEVLSCVGGRRTARALLGERLVADVYLTTSPVDGGEPGTPYYGDSPPVTDRILLKEGRGVEYGVQFEHLILDQSSLERASQLQV